MSRAADNPRTRAQSGMPAAALPTADRTAHSRGQFGDRLFRLICQAGASLVVVLAGLLLLVLVWKSWLAIHSVGLRFFTTTTWDPEPNHRLFGSLAFIYGTVATSLIAMLIAVPLAVATAVYLSEIAPAWLRKLGAFFVEMLAAIPSVVYGFWALFVFAPVYQKVVSAIGGPNNGGVGILSAGIILSIMILPFIASISFDVCRAVPRSQRQASLALGATRWQTIWAVVLPYARPGIFGGCFLALGRALGETMAVTMLIGNRPEIRLSPFAMGNSIASVIANEFTEATYDLYLSALVELGLVLLVVSIAVNTLARLLIRRVSHVGPPRPWFGWLRGKRTASSSVTSSPTTSTPLPTTIASRPASKKLAADSDSPPASVRNTPSRTGRSLAMNHVMTGVLGLCLLVTIAPLFLILGHLCVQGFGALDWDFFVKLPAPVGETGGGMANAIVGSCLLIGLATLFAVPVGLLAAIYLVEYRSDRLGPTVRFIGELLGGVPSIVIGIFAYNLIVIPLGHFSGWAGGFALGVMMVPIVMRASEEALKLVPASIRHASYGLGATQWQTVVRVSVPAALPAIITAVFLGIARIGGETAPLLLTASSNQYWPTSPNDFMPSLPVYIFTYAVSPYDDWHRQAWAAALVLLAGIMLLNIGVRTLTGKRVLVASAAD